MVRIKPKGKKEKAKILIKFSPFSFVQRSILNSQNLPKIIRQHFSPPIPIVVYVVSPYIEHVRNAFGMQKRGKFAAAVRRFECALSGDDDDRIRLLKTRQMIIVVQILEIHHRIVEINIVVVITFRDNCKYRSCRSSRSCRENYPECLK